MTGSGCGPRCAKSSANASVRSSSSTMGRLCVDSAIESPALRSAATATTAALRGFTLAPSLDVQPVLVSVLPLLLEVVGFGERAVGVVPGRLPLVLRLLVLRLEPGHVDIPRLDALLLGQARLLDLVSGLCGHHVLVGGQLDQPGRLLPLVHPVELDLAGLALGQRRLLGAVGAVHVPDVVRQLGLPLRLGGGFAVQLGLLLLFFGRAGGRVDLLAVG